VGKTGAASANGISTVVHFIHGVKSFYILDVLATAPDMRWLGWYSDGAFPAGVVVSEAISLCTGI